MLPVAWNFTQASLSMKVLLTIRRDVNVIVCVLTTDAFTGREASPEKKVWTAFFYYIFVCAWKFSF